MAIEHMRFLKMDKQEAIQEATSEGLKETHSLLNHTGHARFKEHRSPPLPARLPLPLQSCRRHQPSSPRQPTFPNLKFRI
ncbi:hypothetical protein K1719_010672 [Acacia pycnantha]|nr:hypothetical protein K1719_010672 [Acacia pycnantha]